MVDNKFKMIKVWAKKGFWNKSMVEDAVKKGWITEEEKQIIFKEIFKIKE